MERQPDPVLHPPGVCHQVGRKLWVGQTPYYGGYNLNVFDTIINLYPWVDYVCPVIRSHLKVRMYDNSEMPRENDVMPIVKFVNASREFGHVLVHCQQGINRSALIAAASLMTRDGMKAKEAIAHIRQVRSEKCLKNPIFEAFLLTLK